MLARLHRSDASIPGIARRRRGRGFSYHYPDGEPVRNDSELERIGALAIPPAWSDVWICIRPTGHLQAVGTDAAGRRQYLYHLQWQARRSRRKFEHMREFATALTLVRARVGELLAAPAGESLDLSRERVLAAAVRLLDTAWFRIGTEQYATENGSHGLMTLRRTHLALLPPATMTFDFPGKHGVRWHRTIEDPEVFAVMQVLRRRRSGPEALLAWRAEPRGRWSSISPDDVNAFLREHATIECSAKDFRTWHGTVLCAVALASQAADARERGREPASSTTACRREIAAAVRETAAFLGNTPAVCRSSYVDPRLFDRYRDGKTIQPGIERIVRLDDVESIELQCVAEIATLQLLDDRSDRAIARAADRVIEAAIA